MDTHAGWGYKCATLFQDRKKKVLQRSDSVRYQMDREFLSQIDQVKELLPEPADKLDDATLICECFCVNAKDIRQACSAPQKVDIRLLQQQLSLGHGCQSCLKNIDSWIYKIF